MEEIDLKKIFLVDPMYALKHLNNSDNGLFSCIFISDNAAQE